MLPAAPGPVRRPDARLASAAALALGFLPQPQTVPALVALLDAPYPELRRAVATSLQHLTNRADYPPAWWGGARALPELVRAQERWAGWWAVHRQLPRDRWLEEGFAAAGYRLSVPPAPQEIPRLIAARADRRAHLQLNAEEVLRSLAEQRPWRPGDSLQSSEFWQAWWQRLRTLPGLTAG